MEPVLGISLYSYLYLKLAKMLCLSYYCYVFSSTKLEKRAKQVLPRSKGVRGQGRGWRQVRKMSQTMYTHMNKLIHNKKLIN
jgi:hypothetical protein